MKLKTLKDISGTSYYGCDCEDYDEGCVSCMREHIKQEAIKWVKAFIKEENPAIFQQMLPPPDFRPVKLFIMEFFNITEDDLK